jgi:membrane protease YdiL (CAAX protease family)
MTRAEHWTCSHHVARDMGQMSTRIRGRIYSQWHNDIVVVCWRLRPADWSCFIPMYAYVYKISISGWFHLGYFGLLLPILAIVTRKKVFGQGKAVPNRLRHFQSTSIHLGLCMLLSLFVAFDQRIWLFPRAVPSVVAIAAGVAMYATMVLLMRPNWRKAVQKRAPVVHLFMPENAVERAWWIGVSFLAGIGEEITWRGVQAALVTALTGSFGFAALLAALSFGLTHIIQGWRSAAIIAGIAIGFHILVWLAGSLYVAMAVHVLYDLTAGIAYGRLGRELGYRLEIPVHSQGSRS